MPNVLCLHNIYTREALELLKRRSNKTYKNIKNVHKTKQHRKKVSGYIESKHFKLNCKNDKVLTFLVHRLTRENISFDILHQLQKLT